MIFNEPLTGSAQPPRRWIRPAYGGRRGSLVAGIHKDRRPPSLSNFDPLLCLTIHGDVRVAGSEPRESLCSKAVVTRSSSFTREGIKSMTSSARLRNGSIQVSLSLV